MENPKKVVDNVVQATDTYLDDRNDRKITECSLASNNSCTLIRSNFEYVEDAVQLTMDAMLEKICLEKSTVYSDSVYSILEPRSNEFSTTVIDTPDLIKKSDDVNRNNVISALEMVLIANEQPIRDEVQSINSSESTGITSSSSCLVNSEKTSVDGSAELIVESQREEKTGNCDIDVMRNTAVNAVKMVPTLETEQPVLGEVQSIYAGSEGTSITIANSWLVENTKVDVPEVIVGIVRYDDKTGNSHNEVTSSTAINYEKMVLVEAKQKVLREVQSTDRSEAISAANTLLVNLENTKDDAPVDAVCPDELNDQIQIEAIKIETHHYSATDDEEICIQSEVHNGINKPHPPQEMLLASLSLKKKTGTRNPFSVEMTDEFRSTGHIGEVVIAGAVSDKFDENPVELQDQNIYTDDELFCSSSTDELEQCVEDESSVWKCTNDQSDSANLCTVVNDFVISETMLSTGEVLNMPMELTDSHCVGTIDEVEAVDMIVHSETYESALVSIQITESIVSDSLLSNSNMFINQGQIETMSLYAFENGLDTDISVRSEYMDVSLPVDEKAEVIEAGQLVQFTNCAESSTFKSDAGENYSIPFTRLCDDEMERNLLKHSLVQFFTSTVPYTRVKGIDFSEHFTTEPLNDMAAFDDFNISQNGTNGLIQTEAQLQHLLSDVIYTNVDQKSCESKCVHNVNLSCDNTDESAASSLPINIDTDCRNAVIECDITVGVKSFRSDLLHGLENGSELIDVSDCLETDVLDYSTKSILPSLQLVSELLSPTDIDITDMTMKQSRISEDTEDNFDDHGINNKTLQKQDSFEIDDHECIEVTCNTLSNVEIAVDLSYNKKESYRDIKLNRLGVDDKPTWLVSSETGSMAKASEYDDSRIAVEYCINKEPNDDCGVMANEINTSVEERDRPVEDVCCSCEQLCPKCVEIEVAASRRQLLAANSFEISSDFADIMPNDSYAMCGTGRAQTDNDETAKLSSPNNVNIEDVTADDCHSHEEDVVHLFKRSHDANNIVDKTADDTVTVCGDVEIGQVLDLSSTHMYPPCSLTVLNAEHCEAVESITAQFSIDNADADVNINCLNQQFIVEETTCIATERLTPVQLSVMDLSAENENVSHCQTLEECSGSSELMGKCFHDQELPVQNVDEVTDSTGIFLQINSCPPTTADCLVPCGIQQSSAFCEKPREFILQTRTSQVDMTSQLLKISDCMKLTDSKQSYTEQINTVSPIHEDQSSISTVECQATKSYNDHELIDVITVIGSGVATEDCVALNDVEEEFVVGGHCNMPIGHFDTGSNVTTRQTEIAQTPLLLLDTAHRLQFATTSPHTEFNIGEQVRKCKSATNVEELLDMALKTDDIVLAELRNDESLDHIANDPQEVTSANVVSDVIFCPDESTHLFDHQHSSISNTLVEHTELSSNIGPHLVDADIVLDHVVPSFEDTDSTVSSTAVGQSGGNSELAISAVCRTSAALKRKHSTSVEESVVCDTDDLCTNDAGRTHWSDQLIPVADNKLTGRNEQTLDDCLQCIETDQCLYDDRISAKRSKCSDKELNLNVDEIDVAKHETQPDVDSSIQRPDSVYRWRYAPSLDEEVPVVNDESRRPVAEIIAPLHTCLRPLRLGLSRRHRTTTALHPHFNNTGNL